MLRSIAVLAVLALALVPTAASAKEAIGGQACGAADCVELSAGDARPVLAGGPEVAPPARASAFYELRARVRSGDGPSEIVTVRVAFVPAAGLLRGESGTWMRPASGDAAALRGLVAGLEPRPAHALLGLAPELRAASPPPAPRRDDGGSPVVVLAGIAAAAAAAAIGLATVRRRRAIAPS